MGVPKFYRWLSERYPLINQMISNSSQLPEIDNFYLDMNGIIHACTHPNDSDVSLKLTLRDMILAIFRYIDRCVSGIVKPKKLLFLAIDGCAPRAKLNQQRSRRFRAGQERAENMLKARQRGESVDEASLFDSNCITPGTEFMEIIDTHLRWYIRKKMKEDPIWRDLEVIYSGHDVPGEGEHKIIQYIRDARAAPGYQPNQRHCMYGQDADLIMLGLGTHEPHFTLLREVINFGGGKRFMGQREAVMKQTKDPKFQLLHLSVLREYIEADFASGHTGNDFLPHLPTLDIGENAFDVIFGLYQDLQKKAVRYIVCDGEIGDFDRLEELFEAIGVREAEILRNREVEQKEFNAKRRKYRDRRADIPSLEQEEEAEEEMQRALEVAIAEAAAEVKEGRVDGMEYKSGHTSATSSVPGTPPVTPQEGVVSDGDGGWIDVAAVSRGLSRSLAKDKQDSDGGSDKAPKDYRGMYYYHKFKAVPGTPAMDRLMTELTGEYLKGLMWCLSYYFKGCVSWSWYFPFYYGPMLYDMRNLKNMASGISFDLGQPFQPFQQLLGCLPPTSKSLLPTPYQWIMTSPMSPVLEYYPNDFEVDMDGKKNPWEAVVILPFIDSDRLKAAEAEFCAPSTLSPPELRRNAFGRVQHYTFDPQCMDTVPSCNPAIGLLDIVHCQTRVQSKEADLSPGKSFVPMLIPGTVKTCAGFPSLGLIPIEKVSLEAIKLNVFGSDSKYRSLIISVLTRGFSPDSIDLKLLLNRSVFVNYPLLHEAKVVGVSCEDRSYRLKTRRAGSIEEIVVEEKKHDDMDKLQWRKESSQEEAKYMRGRGVAGTGGIAIGTIVIRLRVVPLQGMKTDRLTGIRKKVFGEDEADVPIQMALWTSPVSDSRFEEQDEVLSVSAMYPHGCTVVATEGPFVGCSGRVVGPHGPVNKGTGSRDHLSAEKKGMKDQSRAVDVEFTVNPPEPPFGYALNLSIREEYVSGREASRRLGINTSVLGMITGSLVVDPLRQDIGLGLKKNGEYQLLEYARAVVNNNPQGGGAGIAEPGKVGGKSSVWRSGDTVQIVGSLDATGSTEGGANGGNADGFNSSSGYTSWEYSEKALELIEEYRREFPTIFFNLQNLSHQKKYTAKDIFGVSGSGEQEVDKVLTWMKNQPFFHLARSPLTTSCISREGIRAIERAVDVRTAALASEEGLDGMRAQTVVKKKVPLQTLFKEGMFGPFDAPLEGLNDNFGPPELGDRVVNLVASAVPFGLKGTVIAIHSSSAYVEVLFDEEFAGGKSLQGLCSAFRGALVAWSSVLKVSQNSLPGQAPKRRIASRQPEAPPGSAAAKHTKGQLPPPKTKKTKQDETAALAQEAESSKSSAEAAPVPTKVSAASKASAGAPSGSGGEMKNVTGILKRNLQQPATTQAETKSASNSTSTNSTTRPSQAKQQSGSSNESSQDGVKNITAMFKKELNITEQPPDKAVASTPPSKANDAIPVKKKQQQKQSAANTAVANLPPPAPASKVSTAAATASVPAKKKEDASSASVPPPVAPSAPSKEETSLTAKLAKARAQMKASSAKSSAPAPAPVAQTPQTATAPVEVKKSVAAAPVVKKSTESMTDSSTAAASPAAAAVSTKKTTFFVPSRVIAKKHIAKK